MWSLGERGDRDRVRDRDRDEVIVIVIVIARGWGDHEENECGVLVSESAGFIRN